MLQFARTDAPKETEMYGLGQIFRDFKSSPTKFDFLSRDGELINGKIYMRRMIRRVI